jgi:SPP1 gp7 family putative phage head morphogenesis protein
MPLPILPRNINDPTGQDRRERGAINEFTRKMNQIGREMKKFLDAIPYQVVTLNAAGDELKRYQFNVDTIQMDQIAVDIAAYIDGVLLEGGQRELWFLTQYVQPAYQQGTAVTQVNMATQSSAYALSRPNLESILLSPAYRTRLGYLRAREWEEMKNLSSTTATGMTRILFDGMAAGQNPNVIAAQLAKETDLDIVRARRIARTEITTALRRARLDEAEDAQISLGILTKMMQISALSATTRPSHAARHAKLYTIEEMRVWMSTSPNMINCKCSFVEVLVNDKGQPLTPGIIAKAEAQR